MQEAIQRLAQERGRIYEQMKAVIDTADAEGRSMTAEESQTYERLEADFDAKTAEQQRLQKLSERGRDLSLVTPAADIPPAPDGQSDDERRGDYQAIFDSYVRRGMLELDPEQRATLRNHFLGNVESRAQSVGTTTAGGYLVPEGYQAEIIRTMKDFGAVINVARVLNTNTGAALPWPTVDDTSQVGALLAENTQVAEQDVTIGTKQLDAYKYTSKLVRSSWELMQDSAFSVEDFLRDVLGERVGRILNQHFTTGTGTAQPNGIVTGATSGVTAASGTAITSDELIDLIHSVDPAYRRSARARFMMSDAAFKTVRKLKASGTGEYVFQPNFQGGATGGAPGSLFGYDVEINQDMAAPAVSVKSVLFGDFYAGYVIRLVNGFELIRLDERYADFAQTGFVGFARADGEVVNTAAYKALTQAAV